MWAVTAIDTETYTFESGYRAPQVVCLTWAVPGNQGIIKEDIASNFRYLVSNSDILVGQNIAYDLVCLMSTFPTLQPDIWQLYEEDRIRDTMISYQLEALKRGKLHVEKFSLASLAEKHFGQVMDKDTWRLRYSELDSVPLEDWPEGAIAYAIGDAVTTLQLWQNCEYHSPDEWLRVRGDFALYLCTCWGAETDQEYVRKIQADFAREVEKCDAKLVSTGLLRENGTKDVEAIRQRVKETYPNYKLTKTGKVQADKLALLQSGDPDLILLEKRNTAKKNLTDFVPKLTPVINPSFRSIVRSGRISCSSPNLQQIPASAGVREAFIPRKGFVFVGMDVSRAELCGIAEVCYTVFGFSGLGDTLRKGLDPHSLLGATLEGVSYEEFQSVRRNKNHPLKDQYNSRRHLAKIGNFGKWGGMGAQAFVTHCLKNGVTITLAESQQIDQHMRSIYPEMQLFFEDVSTRGYPHQRIQLRSGRVRGGLGYTDGCNTQFQGLVADAMLDTTYELQFACRANVLSPLYGCYPNFPVHDEWITEVPIGRANECAEAKAKLVKGVFSRWITHVPIDVEYKIMERWTK